MRKFYSLVLMAAALLIGTNSWAATIEVSAASALQGAIAGAQEGDEILLFSHDILLHAQWACSAETPPPTNPVTRRSPWGQAGFPGGVLSGAANSLFTVSDGVDNVYVPAKSFDDLVIPSDFIESVISRRGFMPALSVNDGIESRYYYGGDLHTSDEILRYLDLYRGDFANASRRKWLEDRGLLHYGFLGSYGDPDLTYHQLPRGTEHRRKTRGGRRVRRAEKAADAHMRIANTEYEGRRINMYVGKKFRELAEERHKDRKKLLRGMRDKLHSYNVKQMRHAERFHAESANELSATHAETVHHLRDALAEYKEKHGIRKANTMESAVAIHKRLQKWDLVKKLGVGRLKVATLPELTDKEPSEKLLHSVSTSIILTLAKTADPRLRYRIPPLMMHELVQRYPSGWASGIRDDKDLVEILAHYLNDERFGRTRSALAELYNASISQDYRRAFLDGARHSYRDVVNTWQEIVQKYEDVVVPAGKRSKVKTGVSRAQATAARILLVLAGVEQNPGPPKNSVNAAAAKAQQAINNAKKLMKKFPGGTRVMKAKAAMAASLQNTSAKLAGENDALKQKLSDLKKTVMENDESLKKIQDDHAKELCALQKTVSRARELGYVDVSDDEPVITFAFRGKYRPQMECTFDDTDPIVTVNIMGDGTWWTDAFGEFMQLDITQSQLTIAACTVSCTSPVRRFTNIYNGLVQAREVKEEVQKLSSDKLLYYSMTMDKRAFILCGTITGAGRSRWQNDVPELVPHLFTVPCPADADERLLHKVTWAPNSLKFEASHFRKFRAAPIRVMGETPYIPDATDPSTMKAGLCKRLFPDLPHRSARVISDLNAIGIDFTQLINQRAPVSNFVHEVQDDDDDDDDDDDAGNLSNLPSGNAVSRPGVRHDYVDYENWRMRLFEQAMEGRPVREKDGIARGFMMAHDDPKEAINYYLSKPYKCFIKLEAYPKGSLKPPRFIMSLDLECRGIQMFFMLTILARIEHGTREGNVKGLTEDEKTQKLIRKFSNGLVGETDFSSFESCIGPDLKNVVENAVFANLAHTPAEREFVRKCLCRQTVTVIGPNFTLPKFHHIRMSGDLWTSLGNLTENVCIMSYCLQQPVNWVIDHGLFEGDDGVFPAPARPQEVLDRAVAAGVKLTFDIAPWQALSFCGNHFEEVDGVPQRFRDKYKALTNLCVLYNAPGYTRSHDVMLQRSKALAYLTGPIIPDAFVFAAVIERFTRRHKVDPAVLMRMGLLKEYSAHGIEGCVPDWLVRDCLGTPLSDRQFIEVVYNRNLLAGGECDRRTVSDMVAAMRQVDPCDPYAVLPCPYACEGDMAWYERDGSHYTHADSKLMFPLLEFNDVRSEPRKALPFGVFAHTHGEKVPESYEEPWVRKGRSHDIIWPSRFNCLAFLLSIAGLLTLLLTTAPLACGAFYSTKELLRDKTPSGITWKVEPWQTPVVSPPVFDTRQECYDADLSLFGVHHYFERVDWCDEFSGAYRVPAPVWEHIYVNLRYHFTAVVAWWHSLHVFDTLEAQVHTIAEFWGYPCMEVSPLIVLRFLAQDVASLFIAQLMLRMAWANRHNRVAVVWVVLFVALLHFVYVIPRLEALDMTLWSLLKQAFMSLVTF